MLGEHTDAVLGEVLGYDAARIAALRADGVL
jgi:formyl-CoA transferase